MKNSPFLPVLVLTLLPLQAASAMVATKHVHTDKGDYTLTCDAGPIKEDYAAETASGVPLDGPYAVARGADKGLVRLMSQGGKRTQRYSVPHDKIRAIVQVKQAANILDRLDLVFTAQNLIAVHTSTANGGIFIKSDVYQLPFAAAGSIDRMPLKGEPDLLQMLDVGLSIYQPGKACTP